MAELETRGRSKQGQVTVSGVTKAFSGPSGSGRVVLDDINLTIRKGEFVCLVGASGCGKTTLLRIIGGLTEPTQGVITNASENGNHATGFVFQSDALIPWRTVDSNVGLGLELRGASKAEREARTAEVLSLVQLSSFGKHFPRELSGGMRQRVNIARALALRPSVLLMDEPFAALDAQTREVMQAELLALCERLNATVVFVTHQIDEAVLLADRIVVLSSSPGRVREIVTPPFQRPRDPQIKRTPLFNETVDHVWSLIKGEVEESVRRELRSSA